MNTKYKCVTLFSMILFLVVCIPYIVVYAETEDAEKFRVDNFMYEVNATGKVTVTKWVAPAGKDILDPKIDVIIPSEVIYDSKIYQVEAIGYECFMWNDHFGSVTVSEGITKIESNAFNESGLTELYIPSSVNYIGGSIFSGCQSFKKLEVSSDNGFYSAENNDLYTKDYKKLVSVAPSKEGNYVVKDGVEIIGKYALSLYSVTSITLPSTVRTIEEHAFSSAGSIFEVERITIPNSVKEIGEGAFSHCWVKNITLSNNITKIENNMFNGSSINELKIPDSITYIGKKAFSDTRISKLVLSKNITSIGQGAFLNSSIKSISVSKNDGKIKYMNGVIYSKSGKTIVKAVKPSKNYKIPGSVKTIRPYSFEYTVVTDIKIPSGVTILPKGIFYKCITLKKLDLPATMKQIDENAWKGSGLKTLVMRSKKPPKIQTKQQTVSTVDVNSKYISAYKKALKGKLGYKSIK